MMGAIVHRQVAGYMDEARRSESLDSRTRLLSGQNGTGLERDLLCAEQRQLVFRLLPALPEIDRRILVRFYFGEQTPRQICEALEITFTQFRLRKHRAKQRLEELMREATKTRKIFLRKAAAAGH